MTKLPLDFFSDELAKYQGLLTETKQKIRNTSILRLTVFFAAAIAIYFSTTISSIAFIVTLVIGLTVFIFLIQKHLGLYKQKQWYEAMEKVNTYELSIINMKNNAEFSGKEFIDDDHPFSSDLDIFGGKSIFGIINRSSTLNGKKELAKQLSKPNTNEELIKLRQKAIEELKEKNNWRQEFQAMGFLNPEKSGDVEGLKKWAMQKENDFNNIFYKSMLIINPIIGFSLVLLISLGFLNISVFVFFLILPFMLVGFKLGIINKEHNLMSKKPIC